MRKRFYYFEQVEDMSLLTQSHSDIGVTLNVYTLLGLEDAAVKMARMGELESVRQE